MATINKPNLKNPPQWISENEAAALMGYAVRTLRQYAREGRLPINYTRVNYKTFEYNKVDIDALKLGNSSLTVN
jgi:predicted site-specific integrase-resolvase